MPWPKVSLSSPQTGWRRFVSRAAVKCVPFKSKQKDNDALKQILLSVFQSGKAGSFLSPHDFVVKDPEQEKKFSFCLQDSLQAANSQPLLQVTHSSS